MREKSRSWDLMIWRVFSTATDLLGTHHFLQRCPPQKTSNSQRKKRTMDDHNVLTVALRKPCPNVQTKAVDSVLIGEFNIYDGDWSFLLFNNQKINDPNRKMQKGRASFLFKCLMYTLYFIWLIQLNSLLSIPWIFALTKTDPRYNRSFFYFFSFPQFFIEIEGVPTLLQIQLWVELPRLVYHFRPSSRFVCCRHWYFYWYDALVAKYTKNHLERRLCIVDLFFIWNDVLDYCYNHGCDWRASSIWFCYCRGRFRRN